MPPQSFQEIISLIRKEDPRYEPGAYAFVRDALDYSVKKFRQSQSGPRRHITGAELCQGIREFALRQYGPMAYTLLKTWGLHQTADFGEIVFNLIDYGVFGKTDQDSREDFNDVYSFEEAFSNPFKPSSSKPVFDFSPHQPPQS